MLAVTYSTYGSPDVLRLEERPMPLPGAGEVRLAVRAAALNPFDWYFLRGRPYAGRLMLGLRRPTDGRLGRDVAGVVEALGEGVTRLRPGDAVFGNCRGALAEYACAAEEKLTAKPANVSFEQAAATPVAGFTALQAVRDKARVEPGQRVLVHGAAGGVGTLAVQIAKAFGARVTGVSSARNVEMVRALGAARVVDYAREDFTRANERYDAILDCVGDRTIAEIRRVLEPNARYVLIGGPVGDWLGPLPSFLRSRLAAPFVSQELIGFVARTNPADLESLREMLADGRLTPQIDGPYPLRDAAEAMRRLGSKHARGKVVVTVRG